MTSEPFKKSNPLRSLFATESDSESDSSNSSIASTKVMSNSIDYLNINENDFVYYNSTLFPSLSIKLEQEKVKGIAHQLWPAAIFMCDYFEQMGLSQLANIQSTNVVELGSGIGLGGLFLALCGCRQVILTDLEKALDLLQKNVNHNNLSHVVDVGELCWGNDDHIAHIMKSFRSIDSPPLVIAADCVYWEELFQPFYHTLHQLVHVYNCKIIISHQKRWKKDEKFFNLCKKDMDVQIVHEVIDRIEEDESVRRRIRRIYRIQSKASV
jgi:predicted nicotinamide N-methyase